MKTLSRRRCVPCETGASALTGARTKALQSELSKGWKIVERRMLEKEYKFKDFAAALDFTNRVGKAAEDLGHHPDILLGWGKVKLTLWTHSVGGLSENDFILAAHVDAL